MNNLSNLNNENQVDTFYEVLNMNFDDIKNSDFFPQMYTRWNSFGMLGDFEGEERYNLVCCYEQMAAFISRYPNHEKILNICQKFSINKEDFNVVIFPIIQRVYGDMALSDYDYIEILDTMENIESENILNKIKTNVNDIEATKCALISDEIINYINLKR